jgi:uncharacterized membrane protein YgdD (TMEM256/DUF423 family)
VSLTPQGTIKRSVLSLSEIAKPMFSKLYFALGALFAGLSVVFSAAFAHLPAFTQGVPAMVQTALNQQQFHALGLMLVGLALYQRRSCPWLLAAGGLLLVGMVFFSFNIYARQLMGVDAFRALVPWGGGAWIVAWLVAAIGFTRR